MRYRDVAAAVEWLRSRLGFELHSSVRDDDGAMVYAQVAFGNAMVMLATIQDSALDHYMRQPDEIGGAETQTCYFHVADAAAHFAHAQAAGAEIILALEPYESGGQGYSCRDPEGHIWTFGDFDPWGRDGGEVTLAAAMGSARPRRRLARVLGVLAVLGASGAAAAWYSGADFASVVESGIHAVQQRPAATVAVVRETNTEAASALQERLTAEAAAREAAEQAAKSAAAELERERRLWDAARREMDLMQSRVSAEETARAEAEAKVAGFAAEAERERSARAEAERKAQDEAAMAASHQTARLIAETAAREAQAEADKLRGAKGAAVVVPDTLRETQRLTAEREAAQSGLRQANDELRRERGARDTAEAALRQARDELQRVRTERGTADKVSEEAARRVEAAEAASAAAEASLVQLKSQLATEQAAKRSAWNAINALRKQMHQVQRAKAAADADAGAEPAPVAAKPARKQVQRRQLQPQRKQRPRQQAPAQD
jgi:uncharacterized glyoxalase superfamily protein PhnB